MSFVLIEFCCYLPLWIALLTALGTTCFLVARPQCWRRAYGPFATSAAIILLLFVPEILSLSGFDPFVLSLLLSYLLAYFNITFLILFVHYVITAENLE